MLWRNFLYILLVIVIAGGSALAGALAGGAVVYRTLQGQPANLLAPIRGLYRRIMRIQDKRRPSTPRILRRRLPGPWNGQDLGIGSLWRLYAARKSCKYRSSRVKSSSINRDDAIKIKTDRQRACHFRFSILATLEISSHAGAVPCHRNG